MQLTLFTLLALSLCMNTLFHYDCLGHQELENIAHDGLRSLMELELVGRMGQTVTTSSAPAELIIFYFTLVPQHTDIFLFYPSSRCNVHFRFPTSTRRKNIHQENGRRMRTRLPCSEWSSGQIQQFQFDKPFKLLRVLVHTWKNT